MYAKTYNERQYLPPHSPTHGCQGKRMFSSVRLLPSVLTAIQRIPAGLIPASFDWNDGFFHIRVTRFTENTQKKSSAGSDPVQSFSSYTIVNVLL